MLGYERSASAVTNIALSGIQPFFIMDCIWLPKDSKVPPQSEMTRIEGTLDSSL